MIFLSEIFSLRSQVSVNAKIFTEVTINAKAFFMILFTFASWGEKTHTLHSYSKNGGRFSLSLLLCLLSYPRRFSVGFESLLLTCLSSFNLCSLACALRTVHAQLLISKGAYFQMRAMFNIKLKWDEKIAAKPCQQDPTPLWLIVARNYRSPTQLAKLLKKDEIHFREIHILETSPLSWPSASRPRAHEPRLMVSALLR